MLWRILLAAVCACAVMRCDAHAYAQTVFKKFSDYSNEAIAHRKANYKPEQYWTIYYTSTHAYRDAQLQTDLRNALAYVMAASSYQEIIEYCTPQTVMLKNDAGDLVASEHAAVFDLWLVMWNYKQWCKVLEKYPYKHYEGVHHPLVVRADWLIMQLLDTTKSDALYRLLYNNEQLTRDQFIKFWGGNTNPTYHYGIPETDSKVAGNTARKRWLLNLGNNKRTYLWHTLDFFVIDKRTDPLSNLLYPTVDRFKKSVHNGEELIAGNPKFSLRTQDVGALPAYLLADGNGKRVEEAPGTLVRSDGSFRGYTAITNNGGCMNCHKMGLIASSGNDYIGYLAIDPNTGNFATAKAEYQNKLLIDKFALRSPERDIKTDNALFTAGVLMCNGLTPTQNILAIQRVVRHYDAPVTLEQAAWEVGYDVDELVLAMAWHNANNKYNPLDPLSVNARFSDLGKGRAIPRSTWEDIFTFTVHVVDNWRKATKGRLP